MRICIRSSTVFVYHIFYKYFISKGLFSKKLYCSKKYKHEYSKKTKKVYKRPVVKSELANLKRNVDIFQLLPVTQKTVPASKCL